MASADHAAAPTDPLFDQQWYLGAGNGIQVASVWADYAGRGVRVAVFDQGIDPAHPDLDGNLQLALGRRAANLAPGGAPELPGDDHGTMVAGVIAAERDGAGIVGVAWQAELVSIYSPLGAGLPAQIANAYRYAQAFDVLNDSWGYGNAFMAGPDYAFVDDFRRPTFAAAGQALADLASQGRNGLGTVVVQSAGNSYAYGDDTNLHNFQNSQFIITVAATDQDGQSSLYSTPGSSILVSAPGGGGNDAASDILTTDRVGAAGSDPSNYTSTAGTSFSAPLVSGIVALMLQAQPGLGYRDVQQILAYSARRTEAVAADWQTNDAVDWNGGGLHFDAQSNMGFGLVDARAAVRLAESWRGEPHTAGNRLQASVTRSPNLAIPDNGNPVADQVSVGVALEIERVEIDLRITHPYVGDLVVALTAPGGTTSTLLYRPGAGVLGDFGSSQNNVNFVFTTVLAWGERSEGTWTLGISDNAAGDFGRLTAWTLNLIGKPVSSDDDYVYTDEFARAVSDQPARAVLADSGGVDRLNAAALSAAAVLDLNAGATSTLAGQGLTLAAGTTIEDAVGGDGDDLIRGNGVANVLAGMRGNDVLEGGAGTDTALLMGARAGFQVVRQGDGSLALTDLAGWEGSDTLRGIERLQFAGSALAFDLAPAQAAGAVALLVGAVLGRDAVAQQALVGSLLEAFDAGVTLAQASAVVVGSGLMAQLAGGSDNLALVGYLWQTVLQSAPPPAAAAQLAALIGPDGLSQAQFLEAIALSALNQSQVDLVGLQQTGLAFV